MPEKKFPTSGNLSTADVFPKFGTTSLRTASQKLGLTAPDVFPNDFYGKVYLQIQDRITVNSGTQAFSVLVKVFTTWTVSSNVSWITFPNSTGNSVPGIGLKIAANTGAERSGTVTLTSQGESVSMIVVQKIGISIPLTSVYLAFSRSESSVCNTRKSRFYLPVGKDLFTTDKIYANSSGSILAAAGYYSNDIAYRYWNGTSLRFGGFCIDSFNPPFKFKQNN